ncbi:glycogen synthase [Robertmurraya siralis]|uniref:Glycogen synthase n=1 Tax=Robertmurraya siralis TaxID=77777 RepID=A0A920BSJ1_9BACI|nr:glycogen/starch synthase [Robertmurraya siralis]PAE22461.1 starch synthase [Bacillus sp. 7504-2]GIN61145.1 glycogen synthase [Robertmurraya siralis]
MRKQEIVNDDRVKTEKNVNWQVKIVNDRLVELGSSNVSIRRKSVKETSKVSHGDDKINILIAASEGAPFFVTGGLGEVIGSLPKAIMKEDSHQFDIRVVLPLYESIRPEDRSQLEFLGHFDVSLSWRKQYCGVFQIEKNGVIYYFIDNEFYFRRTVPYGYGDDGERFAFFSKAVLESIHLMNFQPTIIHCHDWQTALIPVYLHFTHHNMGMKSLFTIHNIEYQGIHDLSIIDDIIGLPKEAGAILEYKGAVNLMKAAIETAHQVNTVSPSYATELRYDYFAKGLASIIQRNEKKLLGILNGIDIDLYNPQTDSALFTNYDRNSLDKKRENKLQLQKLVNLPADEKVPLLAIVSRLVPHKGLDLVTGMMEKLMNEQVQVIVLGIGERKYEDYFRWIHEQYQGKVAALISFNQDLARKIYAGADFFLMPSQSEPCGLAQMIALRYGTVPIVHAVGGLRDTIQDCSIGEGNGFVFEQYNSDDLFAAIKRGLKAYENEENWDSLLKWVMNLNYSWEKSAKEYEKIYLNLNGVHV